MKKLKYEFCGDIPLIAEADVIVAGGGPGGIGAAVMSARAGAKTVLIERYGLLGGMASFGEVHPFMPNHTAEKSMDRPVYIDWLKAMKKYYPDSSEFKSFSRVKYPIDIHNPNGTGTELIRMDKSEWYEIPYGCIVPKDCDNLLVGGRPISADHAMHSSLRVMPPACSLGQAAGLAAAISCKKNLPPPKLDGCEIRKSLKEFSAFL